MRTLINIKFLSNFGVLRKVSLSAKITDNVFIIIRNCFLFQQYFFAVAISSGLQIHYFGSNTQNAFDNFIHNEYVFVAINILFGNKSITFLKLVYLGNFMNKRNVLLYRNLFFHQFTFKSVDLTKFNFVSGTNSYFKCYFGVVRLYCHFLHVLTF